MLFNIEQGILAKETREFVLICQIHHCSRYTV